VVLSGCFSVGPDYETPDFDTPEAWGAVLEGGLTAEELDPEVLATWWTTLGDERLNTLIDRAIEANLDLRTAEAQLRQARAQRGVAGSERFPTIGAGASVNRADQSDNVLPLGTTTLYSTSFDAAWELDVFGGRRRAIEAADADLLAAQEARRDVLISVLAEVAVNYVELRTFQLQLEVAQKNLDTQVETLEIVQAQYDAGAVTGLDLNRAVSNVSNTRSEIPRLNQSVAEIKNRLAVLIGEPPGTLNTELEQQEPLPVPETRVAVGIPAETLRRRPDVRRAERQLAAETARIGVATAELYPQFRLNGTIGLESLSLSSLTESDSRAYGVGAGVRWNVFNGGRVRQQIEVQNAIQEQAMVRYEASILTALEEVDNAITALTEEQLRYRELSNSAEAALRAAEIAEMRYEAGATDFLSVLDAQRSLLSVQSQQASSEGTIVSNLVRLYKALGGGWIPEQPEQPEA
ncbi:MAG: efflux transporter outer membrane subunit, partial [bacterium]